MSGRQHIICTKNRKVEMHIVRYGSSGVISMDGQSEHGFESSSTASKLWQNSLSYFAGVLRNRPCNDVGPFLCDVHARGIKGSHPGDKCINAGDSICLEKYIIGVLICTEI